MKACIAVFDIGKTNKKLLLFDRQYEVVHAVSKQFTEKTDEDGYPCEDLDRLTAWVRSCWQQLEGDTRFDIQGLTFTTYGASFVHLDRDGNPVTPLYNYLKPFPEDLLQQFYDKHGDQTRLAAQTASPPLGMLNSGLQLYWLKHTRGEQFRKIRYSLHLPQYFSRLFSGKAGTEYTSIGCHTGLWDFAAGDYHSWVKEEQLDLLFPPLTTDPVSGTTRFRGRHIPTGTGLHDSSAALIPYRQQSDSAFLLLSTGTWGITLNPFSTEPLTPELLHADCLNYMTPEGNTVRASRFFLGHYHDQMVKRLKKTFHPAATKILDWKEDDVAQWSGVTLNGHGTGFEQWDLQDFKDYRHAYATFLRALVKRQSDAIRLAAEKDGRHQDLYIDGGFSKNLLFTAMMAREFPDLSVKTLGFHEGTALGAARQLQLF